MSDLNILKKDVLAGRTLSRAEALSLACVPLDELCAAAEEIRSDCCGNTFDLCAIINAKSGRCSEDCAFCAQSARHRAAISEYELLDAESILAAALEAEAAGVLRFSIVTSGGSLSDEELASVARAVRLIRERTRLSVCISLGILTEAQYRRLGDAGAGRVHNNLETGENYFPKICTTHSWQDKRAAVTAAIAAGLSVCSGGIIGLGESMEDRVDMVLAARELGVDSIPVNILNPIAGTPLAGAPRLPYDEIRRTIAIFRFILPHAAIRMAGGRGLLPEAGLACFKSGANAAITGDMLTTSGIAAARDIRMISELGFEVRKNG